MKEILAPMACPPGGRCRHLIEELDLRLPFWHYFDLYGSQQYAFLLDSALAAGRLGRYSFLGGNPGLVYRAKRRPGMPPGGGADVELRTLLDPDGRPLQEPRVTRQVADPLSELRRLIAAWGVDGEACQARPVPLLAGAVGYVGYEAGYFIEDLPDLGADDLALPDVYLMFVDVVMAHCHRTGKSYLSVVGRGESDRAARGRAIGLRDAMLRRIEAFQCNPPPHRPGPDPAKAANVRIDVKQHFDRAGYCRAVESAKQHIFAGDVFEVCMTHRFESPLAGGSPWDLYGELRRVNPAPFACYLNFPEAQVISSSPERFLSLGPDGIAESRPIKGTRPRGATPEEDEQLYRSLLHSEKDRAENSMIVDLVRNDFGRVCKFHTVDVPELMTIERYATVFQMVSTIRGQLEDGLGAVDLLEAAFPGGSMTGAPKIEAMKIIDRLEPVKRGVYSGAIGYFDFGGTLDLNIVIRTFLVKDGICYYNVGGAVVADSDPLAEYDETLDKARALIAALGNLKAGT